MSSTDSFGAIFVETAPPYGLKPIKVHGTDEVYSNPEGAIRSPYSPSS